MLSGCLANLPREGSLRAHDCQWTPQNWPFQDSLLGSQSFRALRTYVIHMSTNSQLRKFWHQFRQQLRFQVFFSPNVSTFGWEKPAITSQSARQSCPAATCFSASRCDGGDFRESQQRTDVAARTNNEENPKGTTFFLGKKQYRLMISVLFVD